jgi:hypothetical protein
MKIFDKNMGTTDRLIRIIGGVVISSLAFWGPSNLWFLLGIIPLISGLVGSCGLYSVLGINTCSSESSCCCHKDK